MLKNRLVIWTVGILSSISIQPHFSPAQDNGVEAEIQRLTRLLPQLKVHPIDLTTKGELSVPDSCCLRIDKLRGVDLQSTPPRQRAFPKYEPIHNTAIRGPIPYVARGIRPFRLEYFDCEFMYGGRHNGQMRDYASTHGFSTIYPFHTPKDTKNRHYPAGTSFVRKLGFNWETWMKENRIAHNRYDLLADIDLESLLLQQKALPAANGLAKKVMLNMEHKPLSRKQLRLQPWYPTGPNEKINISFENRYYRGYANTFSSASKAVRRLGWKEVSIYGWSPFRRTWGGINRLGKEQPIPPWSQLISQFVMPNVDKVNCSVYCFFWNQKNVAFTLANIDENLRLIDAFPNPKPLRPYFWSLLDGGTGFRPWVGLPLPNEEQRAMVSASFFTGIDGIVYWNSSGYSNHHIPNFQDFKGRAKEKKSLMVKSPFSMAKQQPESGLDVFFRYAALNVVAYNPSNDIIQFQRIGLQERDLKAEKRNPVYSTRFEMMKPFLRPRSEPVGAAVEALALIKPIELALRTGNTKIDVTAQKQFMNNLPIIRRIKNGKYHFIFTYDQGVIHGGKPREVSLPNFEGHAGLNLKFKADADSRIYILKEAG